MTAPATDPRACVVYALRETAALYELRCAVRVLDAGPDAAAWRDLAHDFDRAADALSRTGAAGALRACAGACECLAAEDLDGAVVDLADRRELPPDAWLARMRAEIDPWVYDPTCECSRCTEHHAATCTRCRDASARWDTAARLDGAARDEAMDTLAAEADCPEAGGVREDHAAWGHPSAPVREVSP